MTLQLELFDSQSGADARTPKLPQGFRYQPELIGAGDETALLAHVRKLPFREFEFHGYTGKRRVVSFGWRYDFEGRQLQKAADLPRFLLPLRQAAAGYAKLEPEALEQALVTEYDVGAGIGWHRDKAVFGQTIGISLLAPCVFRLRRALGGKWERSKLIVEPRAVYVLSGAARTAWEHSIPAVAALRYSVTFRTLRQADSK